MLRMLLIIFGATAVIVGVLGARGQTSTNRPWHVFLDMKYQPKYGAQGQSSFFADGRSSRMPVTGTVPYSGGVYRTDAGNLDEPEPDFLPDADPIYYKAKTKPDEMRKVKVKVTKQRPKLDKDNKPLKDKDGKEITEPYEDEEERDEIATFFVERIPKRAIENAVYSDENLAYKGWEALMRRGRERYTINCAVCHGDTGLGGQGKAAHGIVGRGIRSDPKTGEPEGGMIGIANYHQDRLREVPDGYLFDVITNGKNTMASYGHQVRTQDRWAIVAYMRALQLSQNADEKQVDPVELPRLLGGLKK